MGISLNRFKTFNIFENTPNEFYKEIALEFDCDFDPCPENPSFDGLKIPWRGVAFVNPPYGRGIERWIQKALSEIAAGHCIRAIFLLRSSTDVAWFHDLVLPFSAEVRFIRGRLKFGKHTERAPFASMLVVFDGECPGFFRYCE